MKVENIINNKGTTIPNQFIIYDDDKIVFQSYKSKIAEYKHYSDKLKVYSDWDYSRTTLKYLKQFINDETSFTYEDKKQFEQLIKDNDNIHLVI